MIRSCIEENISSHEILYEQGSNCTLPKWWIFFWPLVLIGRIACFLRPRNPDGDSLTVRKGCHIYSRWNEYLRLKIMWKEKFSEFVYWAKFTKKLLYSWIVETSVRYCIFSCDKYLIPTKSIFSFWLLCDNSFDYSFEKLYCHTIKISKHTTSDRRPISPIDERSQFLESKFGYKMFHKCSRYSPETTKFKGDIIDENWLLYFVICLSDFMLYDFP